MQIKWSARMTRDTFSRAMNLAFVAFVAFVLQRCSCSAGGWGRTLSAELDGSPTESSWWVRSDGERQRGVGSPGAIRAGHAVRSEGRQVPESCRS